MGYRAEYLDNGKYNLIIDDETVGIVGKETIIKILDSGEKLSGLELDNKYDDIVVLNVSNEHFTETIAIDKKIDRLYIRGQIDKKWILLDKCIANNVIVRGTLLIKIGNTIECGVKIDKLDIVGDNLWIDINKSVINDTSCKGDTRLNILNSDIDTLKVVGKSEIVDIKSTFRHVEIKSDMLVLYVYTGSGYDGELVVDAKNIAVSKLNTFYNIKGIKIKNNLVEYSKDIVNIYGEIASNKINILRKIKLYRNGKLVIGSKDRLEIDELIYVSEQGIIKAYKGAELYIRKSIKFDFRAARNLMELAEDCKILVNYDSNAHRILRANNINCEIVGGIPEDIIKRDSKINMLGANPYKKIVDAFNVVQSSGEKVDYNLDTDWGNGYRDVQIGNIQLNNYKGKVSLTEKAVLDSIKDIKDIKDKMSSDKLDYILTEWDLNIYKETQEGMLSILEVKMNYTEGTSIKSEIIQLIMLGQYLLKAVYSDDIKIICNANRLSTNNAIGLVDEIDTELRRVFINGVYDDKGYFNIAGNKVCTDIENVYTGLKILDTKNNVIAFISDREDLIAFKAKKKLMGSYAHRVNFANNKYTKTKYSINEINKVIEDNYKNSLIRRILEEGYQRDREHKETELTSLADEYREKNYTLDKEIIKRIFSTAFFVNINIKEEPSSKVAKSTLNIDGMIVTTIILNGKKVYDNIYISKREYLYKIELDNRVLYFESEYSINNILKILKAIAEFREEGTSRLVVVDSASKYYDNSEGLDICVHSKTGKMYVVYKGRRLMRLIDLSKAIQFIVKIKQIINNRDKLQLIIDKNLYETFNKMDTEKQNKYDEFIIKECIAIGV